MKSRIHVDQHRIKSNAKKIQAGEPLDTLLPVISVKDYKQNRKAFTATIRHPDGTVMARVVYRPDRPLSCGARVWVETDLPVEVDTEPPKETP